MGLTVDTLTVKFLSKYFQLIPEEYRSRAVIAGGAAASFVYASDVDIYILGLDEDGAYKLSAILDRQRSTIPGMRVSMPGSGEFDELCSNYPEKDDFRVIAGIPDAVTPVQIIATWNETVKDLLQGFDISTHCVAYTSDGTRHTIAETTDLTVSPRFVSMHAPDKALARYRKICLRYGLQPDPAELVRACLVPEPIKKNREVGVGLV